MNFRDIMKKPREWAIAGAIILLLAAALLFTLYPRGNKTQASASVYAPPDGLDRYAFTLVFEPEQSTLAVTMTLNLRNRTGETLTDIVLRTYAGAFASEETSPAATTELHEESYPEGFSEGGILLHGVWVNGESAAFAFDDEAKTALRFEIPALSPGEECEVLLRCVLTIPKCAGRFGYAEGVWTLGNCLPILSVYENGAWRTEEYCSIGDPFISECADYEVTLIAPKGYECAASAIMEKKERGDGRSEYTGTARGAREFALALSDQWQSAEKTFKSVTMRSYAKEQAGAKRALDYAAKALETYASLYGGYPRESFTLCEVTFPFGGMEYAGLTFLSGKYYLESMGDTLELLIAHEAAHQWFYGLVGSDGYRQAWQDEALCEYATLSYVRRRYGQGAYENLKILRVDEPMRERIAQGVTAGSPVSYFSDLTEYTAVVYGRGAALLTAISESVDMDAFLREYCARFAFRLIGREDFENLLNAFAGADLTPLMIDYLDTYM